MWFQSLSFHSNLFQKKITDPNTPTIGISVIDKSTASEIVKAVGVGSLFATFKINVVAPIAVSAQNIVGLISKTFVLLANCSDKPTNLVISEVSSNPSSIADAAYAVTHTATKMSFENQDTDFQNNNIATIK